MSRRERVNRSEDQRRSRPDRSGSRSDSPRHQPQTRRRARAWRIIWRVAVVVGVLVLAGLGYVAYAWYAAPVDTVGTVPFEQPLAIPPLADSQIDQDGRRVFDLTAQQGSTELMPGTETDTWGYNGNYLGPTLRAERGEEVQVNVANEVGEVTTVHWHGMHLPAAMDGGPHQPIEPGDTWSPTWRIDQPAATLWYHPHPHGETEDHIYRGLAGMFIVDDPALPATTRLPHEYGVDDIPVIVQDKRLDDGELTFGQSFFSGTGRLGDTLVVNGTYGPYVDVTTERIRLRLLNASTARIYDFGFSDNRDFDLIASDGGLLPAPVPLTRILLSPGERAEIVVRMEPGEQIELRSYAPDLGADIFNERFIGGADRFDVLQLRAADELRPAPAVPRSLAPAPDLVASGEDADVTREFDLSGTRINDQRMDMDRLDATVEAGATEIWEVTISDGIPHNFHVHGVQFQVVDVDGEPPPPDLSGWKDTVFLRPDTTVRIALLFGDYTDPDLPYMFHCHLVQHEDQGMMGQFVVAEPGESAGDIDEHHEGH
jgi:FtsP/CotA-like multicopper oxidase with cupredoxin domain